MIVALLIVAGFLMAAFFSGSETALISVNWIRLEHWLDRGKAGARTLESFVTDPQRLLGTTLVGTNIAIIMTSSLASWWLTEKLQGWRPGAVALISTVSVTLLMLLLGEILPKVVGRRHSDAITLKVVYPLRVFFWVFSPVIAVVTGAASGILRLFGLRTRTWRRRLTKDQLRLLLTSEGEKAGAVDREETKLISGIFEFSLTSVGEVMVPRTDIVGLEPGATVRDAAALVGQHGFTRLPVFSRDRDRIEGMVHTLDLLGQSDDMGIDAITRPVPHVPETKMCDQLFRELQARRQHMAVIVDEQGSLAGIVTLEDLLEELVGEIEDEYDVREVLIRKVDSDLYMIDGRAELDAIEDTFRIDLPDGDYNTIAGLILKELGRIPEPGDEIVIQGLDIRVISATATRIGKLRIRRR